MNEPILLTAVEVAERLGVSRSFVYERILNAGYLEPVRLGRCVRYRPADIDELVERIAAGQVTL